MTSPNHTNTDIATDGWLSRVPKSLQPYCIIARLDRPIGWWLLLLPSWWAILIHHNNLFETLRLMGLFMIGAILMRAAGCIINDLWDRDIDRKVSRTSLRPLAVGTMSTRSAFIYLTFILSFSLIILLQLPLRAWIMGILSFPLIICYPLAKRITGWPQIVLGFVFSWGILLGSVSASNNWPDESIFWIYAGTVCWIIGYDTIYAIQDKNDDKKLNIGSAALSFGPNLILGITTLYGTAIFLWSIGLWLKFEIDLWILGIIGAIMHLVWQIKNLKMVEENTALKIFKSNRDCGLIITFGLLIQIIFNDIFS